MKKYFVISSAFFLIVSCKNNPTDLVKSTDLTEADKKMITDSIRINLEQYFADVKQNGLTAEFKYLDDTKEFFWVPPGYNGAVGYDSVKADIQRIAGLYKSVDNKWETLTINPLTHELASYTGIISGVMTDTTGETNEYRLIETGTMIKRKSGWKLFYGQTAVIR